MTMADAELIAHTSGHISVCKKADGCAGYDRDAALKLAIECFDRILPLAKKGLAASQPYDHAAEIERMTRAFFEGLQSKDWDGLFTVESSENLTDITIDASNLDFIAAMKSALDTSTLPQRLAAADTLLAQIWRTPFALEKGKYRFELSPELYSALHAYVYPIKDAYK